jgi:hypothetical protein
MYRREETYLFFSFLHLGWSVVLTFSFLCSFNIELSTFLKPCVSRLLEAMCYSSLGALLSYGDGMNVKWGEGGRRGKFWDREGGWKIPRQGKRMCFWFIPKMAWMASSWNGTLVAVGSFQPCLAYYFFHLWI